MPTKPPLDKPMTGAEMQACREAIGWSRKQLSELIWCSDSTIRLMEQGGRAVPDQVAVWLRFLRDAHSGPVPQFHEDPEQP